MILSRILFLASIAVASLSGCTKDPYFTQDQLNARSFSHRANDFAKKPATETVVIKAAGDIEAALNEFRELLGPLNTAPGATGGRREINWDGVPPVFSNNSLFPGDFFGAVDPALPNGRKRGLINTTPGDGFSISDNDFSFINATYDNRFNDFSPAKTFIAVGSTITDNFFKVPGTNQNASVQGFGVVFSGVNNSASTSLEFYDGARLLGSFKVPNNGNNDPGAFSFLGVYFPGEKVTHVRIYCGTAPLSPTQDDLTDGGGKDLVVMDDFIYSEPQNLK